MTVVDDLLTEYARCAELQEGDSIAARARIDDYIAATYQRGFDAASDLVCAAALAKEIRREALEEAAKAVEAIDGRGSYTDTDFDDAFENGRATCAAAIRALIDQPPPEAP